MSAGNHPHLAFKSHRLAGIAGNVVTLDAEVYNPDGTTFMMQGPAHAGPAARHRHQARRRRFRRCHVHPQLHADGWQD
jgi:hypothetical protein